VCHHRKALNPPQEGTIRRNAELLGGTLKTSSRKRAINNDRHRAFVVRAIPTRFLVLILNCCDLIGLVTP
jgi:hypothetical protein